MKAAVLHGPKDIRCEDVPIPKIGVKDVLIKTKAVGICGSDIPRVWAGATHFYPIILGHEISGEIVEVGEEVEKLSLGDRVAVIPLIPCFTCSACQEGRYSSCRNYSFIGSRRNGGFAEFVSVPEANIIKLPKGVSLEEGALLEPLSVALYALMRGGFTAGEKIAILGLGTIGMLVLQWAKIFGAKMIFCSDIVEKKLEIAHQLGADYCINFTKEEMRKTVFDKCDEGLDLVVETVGVPATQVKSLELVRPRARIVYVGTSHGNVKFSGDQFERIIRREINITGSWMSYSPPFPGRAWTLSAHFLAKRRIKTDILISHRFKLEKIKDAFEAMVNTSIFSEKLMIVF